MPLRSVKMKRFIFGFQRRVWCPKCTPESSNCLMVTTAMAGFAPLLLWHAGRLTGTRIGLPRWPGGPPPWWQYRRPNPHRADVGPAGVVTGQGPVVLAREVVPRIHGPREQCTPPHGQTPNRITPSRPSCPHPPNLSTVRKQDLPPRRRTGEAGSMHRIPQLTALALAIWLATGTPSPAGGRRYPQVQRFTWPLPAPHPVVRPFLAPATPYGPGHRGVDLGGREGEVVVAAAAGAVVFAGPVGGIGVVSIEHEGGLRTTYEPVTPAVHKGQKVERGSPIGTLTSGGHEPCTSACLHWGAKRGDTYLNPLRLLTHPHIRLLPTTSTNPPNPIPHPPPISPTAGLSIRPTPTTPPSFRLPTKPTPFAIRTPIRSAYPPLRQGDLIFNCPTSRPIPNPSP
ncbi:M23 family metallopeptidase [Actinocrispum sp. NPDC049592]|uniref:M23 family metallopeptidase n=1 Tax=Actinocrispum sp. NPDC049592 TaxID=3154835 RepID=UPI00343AF83D